MKIHFITPPNIHYIEPYAFKKADQNNAIRPNLGILYVASSLRKQTGIIPTIIDANADNLTLIQIKSIVAREQPNIVGFSVLTFNLLNCLEVCKIIKAASPSTKICFGGWHPTLYPYETLSFPEVDYVIMGEGEVSFPELIKLINKPSNELSQINGIGYKDANNQIQLNNHRWPTPNLDNLPFPAYDLVGKKKYTNLLACTDKLANIVTSRGCPHACIFCDMRQTKYRYRSPMNIIEEIKLLTKKGIKEFFIQDDNFSINKKRTLEFCNLLINSNLNIKYKISSRVDYLDDEQMYYLKASGCHRIYFGVESGSQNILNTLQKGITIDQIENAFLLARKHKIDTFAYIMIGNPNETKQDIKKTLSLIKKIKPKHLHCSICTPMPGTRLYQNFLKNKSIKRDYWQEFAKEPDPNFRTPFINDNFSNEELRKMQNAIQRSFYLNLRVILSETLKTRSLGQFIRKARVALKVIFN